MESYRRYEDKVGRDFCIRLAEVGRLSAACILANVQLRDVTWWRATVASFDRMYRAARKIGVERFADEMMETLEELKDESDPDRIKAKAERIKGLEWLMERLAPDIYGKVERAVTVQQNISGGTPSVRIGDAKLISK